MITALCTEGLSWINIRNYYYLLLLCYFWVTYGEVIILVEKLTIYFYRLKLAAKICSWYVSICWLFRKSSERADAHVTNWLRVENNALLKYSYISIRCVNASRLTQSQFNFSLISSKSIRHLFTNVKRFQKLPWPRNTCIKSINASVVKLFSTGG